MIVVNSFNEEERKEYVPLLKEIDTDREILYENDGSEGVKMTVYPRLNCYHQENQKLIKAIKDKLIHSPSTSGTFKYFFLLNFPILFQTFLLEVSLFTKGSLSSSRMSFLTKWFFKEKLKMAFSLRLELMTS